MRVAVGVDEVAQSTGVNRSLDSYTGTLDICDYSHN